MRKRAVGFSLLSVIEYVFLLLIILECRSVYYLQFNANAHIISEAVYILSFCLGAYALISQRLSSAKYALLFIAIILYCGIFGFKMFSSGVDTDDIVSFVLRFVAFFYCIMLYFSYLIETQRLQSFLCKIVNILTVIAIISLPLWLGANIYILHNTGTTVINWGGPKVIKSYFNVFFLIQRAVGSGLYQNTGIFVEAPMYALSLGIALIYEMVFLNKGFTKKSIVLMLAIGTSLSSTGAILIALVCFVSFYLKSPNIKHIKTIKRVWLPLVLFLALFIIYHVVNQKMSSDSFSIRSDDIRAGLLAWKENLFWGHGYGNSDSILAYMSRFRFYNKGYSNSIFTVLVQGGIYLTLFYIVPFVLMIVKSIKTRLYQYTWFCLCVAVLFSLVIFQYTYLMLSFLALFWAIALTSNKKMYRISSKCDTGDADKILYHLYGQT